MKLESLKEPLHTAFSSPGRHNAGDIMSFWFGFPMRIGDQFQVVAPCIPERQQWSIIRLCMHLGGRFVFSKSVGCQVLCVIYCLHAEYQKGVNFCTAKWPEIIALVAPGRLCKTVSNICPCADFFRLAPFLLASMLLFSYSIILLPLFLPACLSDNLTLYLTLFFSLSFSFSLPLSTLSLSLSLYHPLSLFLFSLFVTPKWEFSTLLLLPPANPFPVSCFLPRPFSLSPSVMLFLWCLTSIRLLVSRTQGLWWMFDVTSWLFRSHSSSSSRHVAIHFSNVLTLRLLTQISDGDSTKHASATIYCFVFVFLR